MIVVSLTKFQLGLWLATALAVSMWPAAGRAYTPEEQQACSDDAMRICGAYVPDVDRITACMVQHRAQLSPGCRVYFRPEPEAAVTPVAAGRPMSIKPASSKKPVSAKSRKSKKPAKPSDG
jgi:hypothetical protein